VLKTDDYETMFSVLTQSKPKPVQCKICIANLKPSTAAFDEEQNDGEFRVEILELTKD
jgi:hypothetical protein